MPTYSNTGTVTHGIDSRLFYPGDTGFATLQILDSLTGVTRTSDIPQFNPFAAVTAVTSTGVGDPKTITLNSGTRIVEIWNGSSVNITGFYNDAANTPGFIIPPGTTRALSGIKEGQVIAIYLTFSDAVNAGECYLSELEG